MSVAARVALSIGAEALDEDMVPEYGGGGYGFSDDSDEEPEAVEGGLGSAARGRGGEGLRRFRSLLGASEDQLTSPGALAAAVIRNYDESAQSLAYFLLSRGLKSVSVRDSTQDVSLRFKGIAAQGRVLVGEGFSFQQALAEGMVYQRMGLGRLSAWLGSATLDGAWRDLMDGPVVADHFVSYELLRFLPKE